MFLHILFDISVVGPSIYDFQKLEEKVEDLQQQIDEINAKAEILMDWLSYSVHWDRTYSCLSSWWAGS